MSHQVTEAQVQQYNANVYYLAQQKGSRLRKNVRQESQKGKTEYFDRIGATEAVRKTSRHGNTPQIDSEHSRRAVTLHDYEWADLVDVQDKLRMLHDPTSDYAVMALWALGRSMDDEIIDAADGTAMAGEEGDTSVSHPNTQKFVAVDSGAGTGMTIDLLRQMNDLFGSNDVDEEEPRFAAVAQKQLTNLLATTEVTSTDYNSVKALVEGKVDTFLGFKFIRTQRLNTQSGSLSFDTTTGAVGSGAGNASGYRKCIFWAKNGLLHSVAQEMTSRVSERDDKSYSTQVYASMSNGAVRMEEVKVAIGLCSES